MKNNQLKFSSNGNIGISDEGLPTTRLIIDTHCYARIGGYCPTEKLHISNKPVNLKTKTKK